MPPAKSIAWKFVDELDGDRWRCPYCKKISSGGVTRLKSHFLKTSKEGISHCKEVPQHIGELMEWLLDKVGNEEDIAWKFVDRLGDDKWRCHHCKEELSGDATGVKRHLLRVSNEGISNCPKMPDTIRKLVRSLLGEAAEEESGEGNGRFSMEPVSRDMPTQAVVGFPRSCDTPSSWTPGIREFWEELLSTPLAGESSSQCEQSRAVGNSDCLQVCNRHPQLQIPMELQHASDSHNIEATASDLQVPEAATNAIGPSSVQVMNGGSPNSLFFADPFRSFFESLDLEISNAQRNPSAPLLSQNPQMHSIRHAPIAPDTELSNTATTNTPRDSSRPLQSDRDCGYGTGLSSPWASMIIEPPIQSQTFNGPLIVEPPASMPPQRESVPHQSINNETSNALQNPTVPSSSCNTNLVPRLPPAPMNMVPCIPSSSQAPNDAPPSPHIPPCGTGLPGPSSLPDMNEGAPMASHANRGDNFEENRDLKRTLEELYSRVSGIDKELEFAASLSVKNPRREVDNWLPDAKKFIKDYTGAASKGCLSPHEVNKLKRKSEDLLRQGKFPKGLFEARETKVSKLLEGKMVGEAFEKNTTKILNYLVGNQVSRLGIYGMGGVGKTTILKHIHNRLLEEANYGNVLWITVSKDFDTQKLQDDIWDALNKGKREEKDVILKETEVSKRAATLHDRLTKRGKCTLIFDDVWEHFDLEEVGIPIRADGFQLALTTRSLDVCCQMQCHENIKIEPLSQKEAESLFLKELGSEVALSSEIKAVVKSIVEECAGLPLGVITIARSMRRATQLFEWKDALQKLEESSVGQPDMEQEVLMKLKFSYDCLDDPKVQQCFLSCALYPEDQLIEKLELIELFIDQGLIGRLETREKQYDRGLTILSILENVCLLEAHWNRMKMHDLIRDMALHVMGVTSTVKAGKGLTGIPYKEYWEDDLEKVSLMKNDIGEFPSDMSPNCPKLTTLLLNDSLWRCSVIPDSFFKKLWGLEVLNLSGCGLTELPNSISDLVNLRALLLRECQELHHIPYVGKLASLRKLDAWGCASLEEIEGLEKLLELRYLDLHGTCMKTLSKGKLGGLLKLQYLKVKAPIKVDIAKLVALETLECYFRDVDDFNKWARSIGQSKRCRYNLTVKLVALDTRECYFGDADYFNRRAKVIRQSKRCCSNLTVKSDQSLFQVKLSDYNPFGNCERRVVIDGWSHAIVSAGGKCAGNFISIPQDVQKLTMRNCDGTTNLAGMGPLKCLEVLCIRNRGKNLEVLWGGQDEEVIQIHDSPTTTPSPPIFASLRLLEIGDCPKLKYLFGYGSKFSLPHLREINIRCCRELVGIMATVTSPPPCPNSTFPNLEKISVSSCDKMKRVVESVWLPRFPNLREITVFCCPKMEEIIRGPPPNMTIPLESLHVSFCDKMRMLLTHEWLIHLRNLRSISVKRCRGMVEMVSGAGQSREGSMIREAGQSHGGSIMTPANNASSKVSLPKLTRLCLDELPQLKSICEVLITCHSIEILTVDKCPELKRIPLELQVEELQVEDGKDLPHILVEDWQRWGTLTWNSLAAREFVQSCRQEVERPGCPNAIELRPIGLNLR